MFPNTSLDSLLKNLHCNIFWPQPLGGVKFCNIKHRHLFPEHLCKITRTECFFKINIRYFTVNENESYSAACFLASAYSSSPLVLSSSWGALSAAAKEILKLMVTWDPYLAAFR